MGLREIQTKWVEKFIEMQRGNEEGLLAAPFLSVPFESDFAGKSGAILLVGKATAGPWCRDNFLAELKTSSGVSEVVEERRSITREHLNFRKERDSRPPAFWRFRRSLGKIGSPVIWTNLAKIGVTHGNPKGAQLNAQRELACDTLKAEIDEYEPKLVVIACDYAKEQITYPVFGESSKWHKRDDGVCWINRTGSSPAILWTDHPERKKQAVLFSWLEKAQELILQSS